jgi:hypothetical protein
MARQSPLLKRRRTRPGFAEDVISFGNYAVSHLGRFRDETQDDEKKSTRFAPSAADCKQSVVSPSYFGFRFCVASF